MKKILVLGPIGDYGGREIEAGFIANVLSSQYDVTIFSTGSLTKKSQVFHFNHRQKVLTLSGLLIKKFFVFRLLSFLSFLKSNFAGSISDYANNGVLKRKFGYHQKAVEIIDELVPQYDVLFICAQLSSNFLHESIHAAKKNNVKVIFRTTGYITDSNFGYLNGVDCFLHHSFRNAEALKSHGEHQYLLIDQCAFNEKQLLQIPVVNEKVRCFLTLARLVRNKNIDVVIEAFQKIRQSGDKLYIIGDGTEKQELMKLAEADNDIVFTGHVSNDNISNYFKKADCVIISHYDMETGPLTGVEAMAAGRMIISAKTGAMQERLPFNDFWFDNTTEDLAAQMLKVKALEKSQVFQKATEIRTRYKSEYNISAIAGRYLSCVAALID